MRRKLKTYNFIIPLVVYPFEVMISIGEDGNQLEKRLKKYNISDDDLSSLDIVGNTVMGRTVMFSTNQTVIKIPRVPITPMEWGNLQHEIFHAVTFVMDRIGMKLRIEESDEAYAYLIGYLTQKIYEHIA